VCFYSTTFGAEVNATHCPITCPNRRLQPHVICNARKIVDNNKEILFNKKMVNEALHFDNKSQTYDSIRPGYPNEIYETISNYKKLDKNSNILEIGAGNGVASLEIHDKWQPKLTLIEPGEKFCELLKEKFKTLKDIKIENTTFEEYHNNTLFDAIFSATAFHWLDSLTKYKKSHDILKSDGLLILYWTILGSRILKQKMKYKKFTQNMEWDQMTRKVDMKDKWK
jgi:SAM-dependent methyltransferase